MLTGEISYSLPKNIVPGEQIGEIIAAAEATTDWREERSTKGLSGLEGFLAPHFSTAIEDSEDRVYIRLEQSRHGLDAWATAAPEQELIKRAFRHRLSPETRKVADTWLAGVGMRGPGPDNSYSIAYVRPYQENMKKIQELNLQDLSDGGHRNPTVEADPNNENLVEIQKEKVVDNPLKYVGAFRGGSLVSFIKTSPWLLGDQLPYGTLVQRWKNYQEYARGVRTFEDDPLGVMALVADKKAAHYEDRQRMIDDLLAYAVYIAKENKHGRVVVPIHNRDEVAPALIRADFEPMRLKGKAFGMQQQLFDRSTTA